jgi:hypothetical protein
MGTTARGYRYPDSTSSTRIWEHVQALAEDINDDISTTLSAESWSKWSASATSAIGTTETVVTSAPAFTYKAHSAYELKIRGLAHANTGAAVMNINLRDTNVSGTQRGLLVFKIDGIANRSVDFTHWVANTGGSDISARVLALTLQSDSSNAVLFNASTTMPWVFKCKYVGVDTDYPYAVAL